MKKLASWWFFSLAGGFVLLFAFFLRLKNLTLLPIFVDEAIYVRWAQVMKAESTLRFVPLSDGKQPLFMWSVIPLFKLFKDPLFAGRFLSVMTGMATLLGLMALTYYLFKSKKAALLTGFTYAISPFMVFFDRMALVDSMLAMFGVWTFLFAAITATTLRLDMAMITGFALGGAYLTKSPALFFSVLLPSTWLLFEWKEKNKARIVTLLKLCGFTLVSFLISQGMYNILRLGPNFHLLTSRNYDYVYSLGHIFQNPIDPFVPHLKDIWMWVCYLGPWPLLVLLLMGLAVCLSRKAKEGLIVLAWFIVPVLAQCMYAKVFTARYILFTIPYLFVISSLWLFSKSRKVKTVGYLVVLLFIIFSVKQDYYFLTNPTQAALPRGERSGYLEDWTAGNGIKEASLYLRDRYNQNPTEKIVVGTDGYFGTLPDGLQIYLNDISQITIVGVEVRFFSVPRPLIDSLKSGNETYLLVNSSRFFIADPKGEGLELVSSYPRATKPDGTHESLLFYRLAPLK